MYFAYVLTTIFAFGLGLIYVFAELSHAKIATHVFVCQVIFILIFCSWLSIGYWLHIKGDRFSKKVTDNNKLMLIMVFFATLPAVLVHNVMTEHAVLESFFANAIASAIIVYGCPFTLEHFLVVFLPIRKIWLSIRT